MSKKQRKASKRRTRNTSTANMEAGKNYELLKRYVRRSACSAAAGMGAFGLAVDTGNAAIQSFSAPPFLQKSLVGDPAGMAPIEDALYPGVYPFRSIGWATEGFQFQYYRTQFPTAAYGIDLNFDGYGDVNFFRGAGYGGYLLATSTKVGYYAGAQYGSGQVQFLSNSTDNPDTDGIPAGPGVATKPALQGFNAGEIIGDGNDVSIGGAEGTMRYTYYPGDWDGVSDNYGNLYGSGGPAPTSSYVGFQIMGLTTGTGSGFGWVEVVVREDPSFVVPELQIIGWAFTDDGTPIAAGDAGTPTPNPDFDGDGDVDGNDFLIWQRGNGVGATQPEGDADFNGTIDGLDLAFWESGFGTTPLQGAPGAVPEPTSLALLAAGAGALAFRRKRSTSC